MRWRGTSSGAYLEKALSAAGLYFTLNLGEWFSIFNNFKIKRHLEVLSQKSGGRLGNIFPRANGSVRSGTAVAS